MNEPSSEENKLPSIITDAPEGKKDSVFKDTTLAVPETHGLTVESLLASKEPNRLPNTDTLKTDGTIRGEVSVIDDEKPKLQ